MPDDVDLPPPTVSSPGALAGFVVSDCTALVLSAGVTVVSTFTVLPLSPLPQAVILRQHSIAAADNIFFMVCVSYF